MDGGWIDGWTQIPVILSRPADKCYKCGLLYIFSISDFECLESLEFCFCNVLAKWDSDLYFLHFTFWVLADGGMGAVTDLEMVAHFKHLKLQPVLNRIWRGRERCWNPVFKVNKYWLQRLWKKVWDMFEMLVALQEAYNIHIHTFITTV